jgi:hypothetical protein
MVTVTVLAAAVLAIVDLSGLHGHAQGRRGGPRDWSHNQIIAARSGPDGDANIARNWRTFVKHAQLNRARADRDPAIDWLDRFWGRPQKPQPQPDEPHLDWSLRTGGFGNVVGSPAKMSFDISASNCTDAIYFSVDQTGSASAVNVIGITNAYAGCPGNAAGTTPTVKFGIALGNGTATSVVPSSDGKVLYVIESRPSASGGPILHAINVDNINSTPGTYDFSTNTWTATHTLTAPTGLSTSEQLFQITFAGVTNNTSSPYLDYDTNQMFFGDSAGKIYRIVNVNTTAAARDTTNFPVSCGTAALNSPVYWNGQVVVTSADGMLYRINTSGTPPFSCIAAQQLGAGTSGGAGGGLSSPVLDVTNNKIIVGTNNASSGVGRGYGTYNLMFAAGEASTSFTDAGAASTTIAPTTPSFDDAFWSTNSGNMYASGTNSGGSRTYLLRVPYNGALGSIAGNAALNHTGSNAVVATSPVTEFLTSAASNPDYIFIGASGGTYNFMNRISSGFGGTNGAPAAMASSFQPAQGVLSGIIIDTRTSTMTGSTATANIYFGTVGVASTTQSTIVQLAQGF